MIVPVRCCCNPGRLLGHVRVERHHLGEGDVVSFVLRPTLSLKPAWDQSDGALFTTTEADKLSLPVGRLVGVRDATTGDYFSGLAFKSNDTPIETLRRIVGFEEARWGS